MENVLQTSSNNGMKKLGQTYNFVFIGMLIAMVGSWFAFPMAPTLIAGWFWGVVIAEFAILFAFLYFKTPPLFYAFTFSTGVALVPVLYKYINADAGFVVVQALTLTAIITGGLTMYALTTKKNFLGYGTVLFWMLVGIIVVSIINLFLASSVFGLIIAIASAILFSFFIIHDTQQVLYTNITPIEAAMGLYLDILNMFMSILQIFGLDPRE